MSLPETAVLLGISRVGVWRLVRRGELPVVRIGSRSLFRPEHVQALIDRCTSTPDG